MTDVGAVAGGRVSETHPPPGPFWHPRAKRRRNIGAQQIFGACPREVVPRICTPPLFDHLFPEKPMPSRDLQKFVHRLQFLRCFLSFFETCPHETCEAYTQRPVSSEAYTSRRGGRSAAKRTFFFSASRFHTFVEDNPRIIWEPARRIHEFLRKLR